MFLLGHAFAKSVQNLGYSATRNDFRHRPTCFTTTSCRASTWSRIATLSSHNLHGRPATGSGFLEFQLASQRRRFWCDDRCRHDFFVIHKTTALTAIFYSVQHTAAPNTQRYSFLVAFPLQPNFPPTVVSHESSFSWCGIQASPSR